MILQCRADHFVWRWDNVELNETVVNFSYVVLPTSKEQLFEIDTQTDIEKISIYIWQMLIQHSPNEGKCQGIVFSNSLKAQKSHFEKWAELF